MKKILLMCVGAVLLLAVSLSATLAMAADDDVAGVSTEKVNIKLLQHRREDDGTLGNFVFSNLVDKNAIYPSYSPNVDNKSVEFNIDEKPYKFWNDASVMGAVDQIVRVKNEFWFNSNAYVRVFFAFEGGAENVLLNCNTVDWDWEIVAKDVKISREGASYNGTYDVYVATYKTKLGTGAITEPCLLQMALNGASTDHDFFAEVGTTYETLVYAQAVQVNGFDKAETAFATAFGDMKSNPDNFFSNINWAASSATEEKN
jgi:hypothetical protein